MIRAVTNFGASADIEAEIKAILNWKADLSAVRQRATEIVQETNREDRLEGVDRQGGNLLALAPSTMKRRQGSPIPFVEHGVASAVIANLVVMVDIEPGALSIGLRWIGMPWIRYHVTGGPVIPERDVFGLSPWALPLLDALVVAESDRQFPGQSRPSGVARGVEH